MNFWTRAFGTALVGAGLLSHPTDGATESVPPRPNIIVILSDDMGFSDIGCYGGEIPTPNLDGLAARGLRFTQFYNTARCCPTRASLLTGLYPHQAGMGHMTNDGKQRGYEGDLSRNAVTIAEVLKTVGYGPYMVGKWHVTRFDEKDGPKHNWPRQRGFDRFYGTIKGGGNYFDPTSLTRDNTFITPFTDPEYRPERFYYTDAISDNAVKFIREHRQHRPAQPFFLYVAYTAAHWPLHAWPEDIARHKGRYDGGYAPIRRARFERMKQLGIIHSAWQLSPQAGDWEQSSNRAWEARCMEVYAAMIECMDRGIGRILDELKRQAQWDNTLIFYLQDNGGCAENMGRTDVPRWHLEGIQPMKPDELQTNVWPPMRTRDGRPVLGGPGVVPGGPDTYIAYGKGWANVSDTPFREYKHWVHEGGISTPLIAHWPARIRAGGELRHQPGHLIDIMATCLEVSGAKYPEEFAGNKITPLEGCSLVPAFDNRPLKRDAIFWEHEGNRAVRAGRWKLVAKGPAGRWELYDMETDRTEMRDLADREPVRVRRLISKWEAYAKRANVLPWIWKPAYGQRAEEGASDEAGATATRFELRPGEDLPRARSPRVAGRGFTVTVEIVETARDGVLLAQGGSAEGFALYLRDGKLHFAVRRAGAPAVVATSEPLPAGAVRLTAKLTKDGAVTLMADDRTLATGRVAGPPARMPVDGLQVGRDEAGAVGEYAGPFPFGGKIARATVELD